MNEKPPDFDWVDHRAKCSVFTVFEELKRQAQANVSTREAQLTEKDRQVVAFRFESKGSEYFYVVADNLERLVRFFRKSGVIEITGEDVDVNMAITLTLNDDGDCRLKVNEKGQFQPWQVLRMALDDLFFDLRTKAERGRNR